MEVELDIRPEEINTEEVLYDRFFSKTGIRKENILKLIILKRSLDSRKRPIYRVKVKAYLQGDKIVAPTYQLPELKNISNAPKVVIVGTGPCGLFAGLKVAELGLKPVFIERGKAVRDRRFDLANLMKKGILNTESNYCFGEGGAGTFSDGKLFTRSHKRGSIENFLNLLVKYGADESILIDTHPHIGTNHLPGIITSIREDLINHGAEFHFSTKLLNIEIKNKKVSGVDTNKGLIDCEALILATGHSARDIYEMLNKQGIKIEEKSFALGVRIEHPQDIVNTIQYRQYKNTPNLPAASYSLVCQQNHRGVYSFCMCPGGIICPASTEVDGLVVNGWSPSSRNSYFANSGLVVEVPIESIGDTRNILRGLEYQTAIERRAFNAGGGKFVAPAQKIKDFIDKKTSSSLPKCSYKPGIKSSDLREILPEDISSRLKDGLAFFAKARPSLLVEDGIMVGVESRTSSPIRIPRDKTCMHPEIAGLFPAGEGAGFAGGIVSAALDGERIAQYVREYIV